MKAIDPHTLIHKTMTNMKTIFRNSLLGLLSLLTVTACEKDEDKTYLNSIEPGQLIASESAIELTQDRSDEIVLSLAWSTDNLVVSDPNLTAPGGLMSMTLEASLDENFSTASASSLSSWMLLHWKSSATSTSSGNELSAIKRRISFGSAMPERCMARSICPFDAGR